MIAADPLTHVLSWVAAVASSVGLVSALSGIIAGIFADFTANLIAKYFSKSNYLKVDKAEEIARKDYERLLRDIERIKAELDAQDRLVPEVADQRSSFEEQMRRYKLLSEKISEAGYLLNESAPNRARQPS